MQGPTSPRTNKPPATWARPLRAPPGDGSAATAPVVRADVGAVAARVAAHVLIAREPGRRRDLPAAEARRIAPRAGDRARTTCATGGASRTGSRRGAHRRGH